MKNESLREGQLRAAREFDEAWRKMPLAFRVGARCMIAANEAFRAAERGAKAVAAEVRKNKPKGRR